MKNYKISTDDKLHGFWRCIGTISLDDGDQHTLMRDEMSGKYYIDLYDFGFVDLALLPKSKPKEIAIELINAYD